MNCQKLPPFDFGLTAPCSRPWPMPASEPCANCLTHARRWCPACPLALPACATTRALARGWSPGCPMRWWRPSSIGFPERNVTPNWLKLGEITGGLAPCSNCECRPNTLLHALILQPAPACLPLLRDEPGHGRLAGLRRNRDPKPHTDGLEPRPPTGWFLQRLQTPSGACRRSLTRFLITAVATVEGAAAKPRAPPASTGKTNRNARPVAVATALRYGEHWGDETRAATQRAAAYARSCQERSEARKTLSGD